MNSAVNYPLNCGLANSSFSFLFSKQTVADRSFDSSYFFTQRVQTSGTAIQVQFNDSNILRDVGANIVNDINVIITPINNKQAFVKTITSTNTNVLSNDSQSKLIFKYVSTGSASLDIELTTGEKQIIPITTTAQTPATADTFVSFVSNTCINHIYTSMANVCNNTTTKPTHYGFYSTYNIANSTFVKSISCWLKDYDLTGLCVATGNGNTRMCTMITPHHAIGIKHVNFHPQIGESVRFLASDNTVVTRIVESVSYVNQYDCSIIKFTQPVPDTVKKYKLLPENAKNYLPDNQNIYASNKIQITYQMCKCPIIAISHYIADPSYPLQRSNRFVYARDVTFATLIGSGTINHDFSLWFPEYDGNFPGDTWLSPIRGGDSGGPCFAIINNDLVLLGSHITSFNTLNYSGIINEIQATINTMGPENQTIQTANLSQFTFFA